MESFEKINDEVFYVRSAPVVFGMRELQLLKDAASSNERHRARLCAHPSPNAALHEMFIVHRHGTYVRPHAHVGKPESFWILEGTCDAVFLEPDGAIAGVLHLDSEDSLSKRYYRVEELCYHTLIVRSPWLAFHEVTSGPFTREGTMFPDWAPPEEDKTAVREYLEELDRRVREWNTGHGGPR
jgi:cupin fold WbuC family metalloprotein